MLEKKEIMTQEEVNKRLEEISIELGKIINIGLNYMEYLAALIYTMYENCEQLQHILPHILESNMLLVKELDRQLEKIRDKEKEQRLFRNIKFSEVIRIQDFEIFKVIITELNDLIVKIEKKDKSKIAEAFEYCIMKAASRNERISKNGEYYTPKGLVKLMVEIADIKDNMAIYNPASGTGEFIVESAKYGEIYAFGEENDNSNYNICQTNLWLHEIKNKRIVEEQEIKVPKVDLAIANPPFVDYARPNIRNHRLMQEKNYPYDMAGFTKNNYIRFLVHMLESIHEHGKIEIIVPLGFLFKKERLDYKVRRDLVEKNYLDAIIGLPEKLFFNTKTSVVVLVIDKAKQKKDILFIDASKDYKSKRKTNILTIENQEKIVNTYRKSGTIENYSYVASLEEIEKNDYDLSINKYVRFHNKIEKIDEEGLKEKVGQLEKERYRIDYEIRELIESINKKRKF